MAVRQVLKAVCKLCHKEHPRTLFAEPDICLFCRQEQQNKADAVAEQNNEVREEDRRKHEQTEAREQLRAEMADLRRERSKRELEREAQQAAFDPAVAARQEIARRMLAKRHLLPFVQRTQPDYQPGWVHKDICEHLEWFSEAVAAGQSPRLAVFMPPRHGKQIADSTAVLTSGGWTTHGQLKVGDEVFHPSGKPVAVLGVSEKTPSDWLVTLANGQQIRCHGNHEWTVYDRAYGKYRTEETQWFAKQTKFGKQRDLTPGGRSTYQLPAVKALEFPERADLAMDPYTLGAWLGDGSRTKPCISYDRRDAAVIERIEVAGYPVSTVCEHNTTGVLTTHFGGPRPNVAGRMTLELGELGLRVSSTVGYKFIPEQYLRGSIAQRLQLLAGLVDTDGHCDSHGRCRFTTADKVLADGVMDLCGTLGFRPYITQVEPTLSSSGIQGMQAYFVVGFQPTMPIPCALPRKVSPRFAQQRRIGIVSVEYVPNGEVGHCIQVDSDDGLYLVGEKLTPTHNSQLASISFPAWHLGKYPHHEFIACSYSSALALKFSRKARALVREPGYTQVFENFGLDADSQSAEEWLTTAGGGYRAAGVGGPITGTGASILLIDDPVKNREEAESETTRSSVWDWYTSTAYTRLAPGGGVLLILTRWHDDDLAGRLMTAMAADEGDEWRVVNYPAVAETDELYRKQGEALHEARYPLEALNRIKKAVGSRDWSALYQQNPVPDDGAFFTKGMFKRYGLREAPPYDEMIFYTAWDLAVGQKQMNDWSVGITVGIDRADNIYVIDVQRGRWDSLTLVEKMLDSYQTWNPAMTGIERGQIEMSIGPLLMKRARERHLSGFGYEPLKPGKNDKVARAQSIKGRMQQGRVFFRAGCDVTQSVINEMLRFPAGAHDDCVDSMAYIGKLLDHFAVPRAPKTAPKKSWKDKLPHSARSSRLGWQAA